MHTHTNWCTICSSAPVRIVLRIYMTLPHSALHSMPQQCTTVRCRVLPCVAECCRVLPCVAVCCLVLPSVCCTRRYCPSDLIKLQHTATHCSMLSCVAVCCRMLQRLHPALSFSYLSNSKSFWILKMLTWSKKAVLIIPSSFYLDTHAHTHTHTHTITHTHRNTCYPIFV